jgi:Dolichyl-phosphate-mannose-protein mannosyltransferase
VSDQHKRMPRIQAARLLRLPVGVWVITAVLMLGLVLRAVAMSSYVPAALSYADAVSYLTAAKGDLFSNQIQPAGFPFFLRVVHFVSDDFEVTMAVQHLLGLAAALALYLAVRRLGVSRWAAILPAAVVALGADQIYLEHTVISDALFTSVVVFAVYTAVRAATDPKPLPWLVATGVLLGYADFVRALGLFLVPVFVLWLVFAMPGSWRRRVTSAGLATAGVIAALAAVAAFHATSKGGLGLTQSGGWAVYTRTAQIADCTKFTPPRGTEMLCESSNPDTRNGPDYYAWTGGPGRKYFGGPPAHADKVGAFGRAVIVHQPLDYLRIATKDVIRYVDPDFGYDRAYSGPGPEDLDFRRRAPAVESLSVQTINSWYDRLKLRIHGGIGFLHDYQQVLRVHGVLIVAFLLFALAGLAFAKGIQRRGLILFAATAFVLYVVPAATTEYTARYGIPPAGELVAAGAVGAWAVARATRRRVNYRGRRATVARDDASAAVEHETVAAG